jgi:cytidylate kinase
VTPRLDTVIAIDGPAASGKTELGLALAAALGYQFLDTGALYRGFTWLALEEGVDPEDERALTALARRNPPELRPSGVELRVQLKGTDVTPLLRLPEVEANVSHVSRHPGVRAALKDVQRNLVERGRIVMAGRDIGTVIAPDARTRIYLHASEDTRRRRRGLQTLSSGDANDAAHAQEHLSRRDTIDSTRSASPLAIPPGACVIDTDDLTIEQVLEAALKCIASTD